MNISLDWISQYVDLSGLTPETISDRFTMATAEVEGIEPLNRSLGGMLVAEVISVEPVSSESELKVVRVKCGSNEYSTVCGAPNVKAGMKSAFAPASTTIAGGQTIEKSEMAGHSTDGILCSARELGLSDSHEGILEIQEGEECGALLADLIPASDIILEVDNKSITHRPDLWGHYGIAREIAAIFGRELTPLPLADLTPYNDLPAYPLTIDDLEGCPAYCCMEMDGVGAAPAPLEIQYRLHALGQRTFNILVDLTNYIMLELGQPMHAFDGSRLEAVRVAPFGSNGEFVTLDGTPRKMLSEDLMIWNEKEPVALAGIMGGLNSEVDETTTKLLLESANFKDSRIRRTATRLGIQTDASQRFEKQQPPVNAGIAVERFLHLMQEAGTEPKVLSRFTWEGDLKDEIRRVEIPTSFFDARIGSHVSTERITSILHSLVFEAEVQNDHLSVGIPPHRSEKDISIKEDILEEVTRIFGYDNLDPRMPDILMEANPFNDSLRAEHKVRRLLSIAHGYTEIHTYSWFDDDWLKIISYEPGETLVLSNPSTEQTSRLQTSLVPGMLAAVSRNSVLRDNFKIYEIGREYLPGDPEGRTENHILCGASFRQARGTDLEEHFRSVKGALESLAASLSAGSLAVEAGEPSGKPWETPGCFVIIKLDGERIGALGFLSDPLLSQVAERAQVVWFELNLDQLEGPIFPDLNYDPPSIYQGSWFDFSVVASLADGFASLLGTLDKFSHPLLRRREFLYMYKGEGMDEGAGSFTFRYWIESSERTLTGEDLEGFQKEYMKFLESEGLKLR